MVLLTRLKRFLWGLTLGCSLVTGALVQAAPPETAPEELTTTLRGIETAANQENLSEIMAFFRPDFENSDGLRYETLSQGLERLFADYQRLNYTITLESWEQQGEQIVAETITTIEGSRRDQNRFFQTTSTIRSRQYFQGSQIVKQEILSETTQITSGVNPPKVQVIAPETAMVRERFSFDVIVEDPVGNDLLLGAAIEEQTRSDRYLLPSTFELDVLEAGGIFKWVSAPGLPGNHWLSAIVVRSDGMVIITKRVRIEALDKQNRGEK